ncbi:M14 family zinc carboxypeptidase [Streptosporangium sp. NPDC005286]|uniref:M14 family zinc carboxypeptidase n=1 Tax=Streptosporangium sp. NPDC005286 TaxID=3154463 RepID=UPI0033A7FFDA
MTDPLLNDELDSVPDHDRFATVDEITAALTRLAADHPGVASLRRVGSSALGEPILCLSVGDGPRHALVGAMPHPNEPIGGLTVIHLATRLCESAALREATGHTWHIVGCLDPDGTRLNEGWSPGRSPKRTTAGTSTVRRVTSRSSGPSPSPTSAPTSTG